TRVAEVSGEAHVFFGNHATIGAAIHAVDRNPPYASTLLGTTTRVSAAVRKDVGMIHASRRERFRVPALPSWRCALRARRFWHSRDRGILADAGAPLSPS